MWYTNLIDIRDESFALYKCVKDPSSITNVRTSKIIMMSKDDLFAHLTNEQLYFITSIYFKFQIRRGCVAAYGHFYNCYSPWTEACFIGHFLCH